jgi:M-phase inducer tyrosine phosphatase
MSQPADDGPFPNVNSVQLRDLIANYIFYGYSALLIIDARFDYEHAGGHIKESQNIRSVAQMKRLFEQFRDCNVCVVFHCEFSQNRGPNLMHRFRDHDRLENIARYPTLDYPTIYLLQGGYSRFFEECPDLCDGGYVPMREARFVRSGALMRSHSRYASDGLCESGRTWTLRRSLSDCGRPVPFDSDGWKPKPFAKFLDL